MGGVIMVASIIIWFLGYYPNHNAYSTTAEQQENSYIGQIGKAIEPAIEPLGFDWKMGIGLLSGIGAKELIVSSLGVLYTNDDDINSVDLSDRIPITPLVAYGYMLFILIYFPCVATVAAIKMNRVVGNGPRLRYVIQLCWLGLWLFGASGRKSVYIN